MSVSSSECVRVCTCQCGPAPYCEQCHVVPLHPEIGVQDSGGVEETEKSLLYPAKSNPSEVFVNKSLNDKKQYRVIQLENKLTCLLISELEDTEKQDGLNDNNPNFSAERNLKGSDNRLGSSDENVNESENLKEKKEKTAAAAMCVGVGSFSNPDNLPGLAHFLEHMLFMGSEKYPDENSYNSFLWKHGGMGNAFTDCEHTVYSLDVNPDYFKKALDRLAQFFISPLLKKDSMDREVEAVDSEFLLCIPDDGWRTMLILGSLAKERHPLSKFSCGNIETLKHVPTKQNIDVREQLRLFRERYYSSHLMTLAVQSKASLDILEEWIREIFSRIPNNGLPAPDFTQYLDPFGATKFHKLIKVVPIAKTNSLMIIWSLPSLILHYKCKPLSYIGELVGHEGPGSILSHLRKNVWAINLSAGIHTAACYAHNSIHSVFTVSDVLTEKNMDHIGEGYTAGGYTNNSMHSMFVVTVELTEKGMDHIGEVITCIYQYLELLRLEGPKERIFEERKKIADNNFRWVQETEPLRYVEMSAMSMQLYPPEHFITGNCLLFEYDEKIIKQCQDSLMPGSASIMLISSRNRAVSESYDTEEWSKAKYKIEDIPDEWLNMWADLKPNLEFHLPEDNKFIATDFDIKEPDVPRSKYPVVYFQDEQMRIFYKKDYDFKCPKACVNFHLVSPVVYASPQAAVMAELFCSLLHLSLTEPLYAAGLASLSFSIRTDDTGFVLNFNGFNHKLPLVLETVLHYFLRLEVDDEMFDNIKKCQSKNYYNSFIDPYTLCDDIRLSIIHQKHWMSIEKRSFLKDITKDMLRSFIYQVVSQVYIEVLAQGNITAEEAKEMALLVKSKLQTGPLPQELMPKLGLKEIPVGDHKCRLATLNPHDVNSVITNYYQNGPGDIREFCLMDLMMLFMSEPCFDILRTQEQLGYHVFCCSQSIHGILAYSICVLSPANKYSCSYIDLRIENFLKYFAKKIEDSTEEEFQAHLTSLIKVESRPYLSLEDEVNRNWYEIMLFKYEFDYNERRVACLKNIRMNEFKDWCLSRLPSASKQEVMTKKISFQVVGNGEVAMDECCLWTESQIKEDEQLFIPNNGKAAKDELNDERKDEVRDDGEAKYADEDEVKKDVDEDEAGDGETNGGEDNHVENKADEVKEVPDDDEIKNERENDNVDTEESDEDDDYNTVYTLRYLAPTNKDEKKKFINDISSFRESLSHCPSICLNTKIVSDSLKKNYIPN